MNEIKKLLEEAGIEKADSLAEQLNTMIKGKLDETKAEYDARLAKTLSEMQTKADAKLEERFNKRAEQLQEWHTSILQTELDEVKNQLKIAAEIKQVRDGMGKLMEGLSEVGINTTQIFEDVAVNEVLSLENDVENLTKHINEQNEVINDLQRAFIISESAKGLSQTELDEIMTIGDSMDKSISLDGFKTLIENLVDQKMKEKKDVESDDKKDDEDGKGKSPVNESYTDDNYGLVFNGKQHVSDDISRYFQENL